MHVSTGWVLKYPPVMDLVWNLHAPDLIFQKTRPGSDITKKPSSRSDSSETLLCIKPFRITDSRSDKKKSAPDPTLMKIKFQIRPFHKCYLSSDPSEKPAQDLILQKTRLWFWSFLWSFRKKNRLRPSRKIGFDSRFIGKNCLNQTIIKFYILFYLFFTK